MHETDVYKRQHHFHPRSLEQRGHGRRPVARPLAHLPGNGHVRRPHQLAQGTVGEQAPNAARARHAEDGLAAVAVDAFLQFLGRCV